MRLLRPALFALLLFSAWQGPGALVGERHHTAEARLAGRAHTGENPGFRIGKFGYFANVTAADGRAVSLVPPNGRADNVRPQADLKASRLGEHSTVFRRVATAGATALRSPRPIECIRAVPGGVLNGVDTKFHTVRQFA